jgi:hypothetical protein
VFALAVCLAGLTLAEDKKPVEKKEEKKPVVNAPPFAFPKQITLSEDQQKKLDALKAEYQPKLAEYQPKLAEINKKKDAITNTPERKKARSEAEKKAKEDGKKGKERETAIYEANKYTDDEKKEIKELDAARKSVADPLNKLVAEINKKKNALLTEEQQKSLQPKPKTEKDKPTTEKDKAPAKDKPTTEKDKAPAKDKSTIEKDKKTTDK